MTAAPSTWAPLRTGVFRTLWIAALVSNVGEWMQTVGAQWLLVHDSHAAILVSLVQTADALPAAANRPLPGHRRPRGAGSQPSGLPASR